LHNAQTRGHFLNGLVLKRAVDVEILLRLKGRHVGVYAESHNALLDVMRRPRAQAGGLVSSKSTWRSSFHFDRPRAGSISGRGFSKTLSVRLVSI
jgi:hypothetical protein